MQWTRRDGAPSITPGLAKAPDGFLWMTSREQLRDVLEAADGALWLTYNKSVLRKPPNGTRFERIDNPVRESALLAADDNGVVWMAGQQGARRLSGPNGQWPVTPSRFFPWQNANPGWMNAAFDHEGNLWIRDRGFARIPGLAHAERAGTPEPVYEEGGTPLMTSKRPASLFVDRRGNIWIGGPRSLDRFHVPSVVAEPGLTNSARYGDVLFTASSGSVYIGQYDALYRVDPGRQPIRLFPTTTSTQAICEDRDESIWVVLGDRVLRLHDGGQTWRAMVAGGDGRLWLATIDGIAWLDPANIRSNPTPPGVAITSLTSGDRNLQRGDLQHLAPCRRPSHHDRDRPSSDAPDPLRRRRTRD